MTNDKNNTTTGNDMLAWGFTHLYDNVRVRDYRFVRQAVTRYLSSTGTYYRYHHGERLLTPEQQRDIQHIFSSFGYDEPCSYDFLMAWNKQSTATDGHEVRWSENSIGTHRCQRLMRRKQ